MVKKQKPAPDIFLEAARLIWDAPVPAAYPQLAEMLDDEAPASDLAAAIAEHQTLVASRDRPGWAWMRVVRRYDDYERTLELLKQERRGIGERERVGASG